MPSCPWDAALYKRRAVFVGRLSGLVVTLRRLPGTAGTIENGGVNVWSKEGRGNVPKFWIPEIKKLSHPEPSTIFNHCLHRALFCPWVAVATSWLSGCASHSALVCSVTPTFGGLATSGSPIGAVQPKKHGKPLQPRTSERIPARKRKISERLPLLRFRPPFASFCGWVWALGVVPSAALWCNTQRVARGGLECAGTVFPRGGPSALLTRARGKVS